MDKVKYTRKEYREEYLQSDHWKTLRGYIVSSGVLCFKCKERPATDAHHMKYRNIVTVKIKDLVPLCRPCHDLVEEAKSIGLIRTSHSSVAVLRVTEESVKAHKKMLSDKVPLPPKVLKAMTDNGPQCYKLVFGIIKKSVQHQGEWVNIRVTGRQLLKIYGAVCRSWKRGPRINTLRRVTSAHVGIHY